MQFSPGLQLGVFLEVKVALEALYKNPPLQQSSRPATNTPALTFPTFPTLQPPFMEGRRSPPSQREVNHRFEHEAVLNHDKRQKRMSKIISVALNVVYCVKHGAKPNHDHYPNSVMTNVLGIIQISLIIENDS